MAMQLLVTYKGKSEKIQLYDGVDPKAIVSLLDALFDLTGTIVGLKREDGVSFPICGLSRPGETFPTSPCELIVREDKKETPTEDFAHLDSSREVFIIGIVLPDGRTAASGTAFPITPRHIITAFHVVSDPDPQSGLLIPYERCLLSKSVTKHVRQDIFEDPIFVRVVEGERENDWVILEMEKEGATFQSFFPLCPIQNLPKPRSEKDEVKTYFAATEFYRNNTQSLEVWYGGFARVLQYDKEGQVLLMSSGISSASCGGPMVNHNGEVVSMHVATLHENPELRRGQSLDTGGRGRLGSESREDSCEVESLTDSVSEYSNGRASVQEGLVLSRVEAVVRFIQSHGGQEEIVIDL